MLERFFKPTPTSNTDVDLAIVKAKTISYDPDNAQHNKFLQQVIDNFNTDSRGAEQKDLLGLAGSLGLPFLAIMVTSSAVVGAIFLVGAGAALYGARQSYAPTVTQQIENLIDIYTWVTSSGLQVLKQDQVLRLAKAIAPYTTRQILYPKNIKEAVEKGGDLPYEFRPLLMRPLLRHVMTSMNLGDSLVANKDDKLQTKFERHFYGQMFKQESETVAIAGLLLESAGEDLKRLVYAPRR